ncbi:MAG: LysE family transporter [Brachymonas sp.]|nr:LysE family transporter [Brachymonas sp.]
MQFWQGFLLITSVHLLAAASPGPDFVMVTQQTLLHGKRTGLWCALGIALGLGVHIAYSILGLAATIAHSLPLLQAVKLAGGAYLLYLGYQGLRARAVPVAHPPAEALEAAPAPAPATQTPTAWKSLVKGFFCNVLNPKAPLYFVSMFTVVLSPDLPAGQLIFYGLWMMVLQLAWFGTVVLVLSHPQLQTAFKRFSVWIDRVCGAAMALLGLKVLSTLR